MNAFIKKHKEIAVIFLYPVVLLGLAYGAIKPLMEKISTVQYGMQQNQADAELRQRQLADMPKIREQLKLIDEKKDAMGALLKKEDAVMLIEKLEKIAEETGNKISLDVKEKASAKKLAQTPPVIAKKESAMKSLMDVLPGKDYLEIVITAKGTYASNMEFLHKMENLEYYNDVVSFEIRSDMSNASDAQAVPDVIDGRNTLQLRVADESGQKVGSESIEDSMPASNEKTNTVSIFDTVFYTKD